MAYIPTLRNSPLLLPVVHITSIEDAIESLRAIRSVVGVRSCFLIDQGMERGSITPDTLRELLTYGTELGLQMGLNILCPYLREDLVRSMAEGRLRTSLVSAYWRDSQEEACKLRLLLGTRGIFPTWTFFHGLAFKYEKNQEVPSSQILLGMMDGDVVTTSGPSTGVPPEESEISDLRKRMDQISPFSTFCGYVPRLAVASGVNLDNIAPLYFAGADTFIVASSIEERFGRISSDMLQALYDRITPLTRP